MLGKVPFYIALFANLMPYPAAFFDSRPLALLPDFLLGLCFLYIALFSRKHVVMLGHRSMLVALFLFAYAAFALLDGRGIGSGGLFLLVFETYCFWRLMQCGLREGAAAKLDAQLGKLFKLHIGFLYFELVMRLAGFSSLFISIAGNATVVAKFKDYGQAAFLNLLGFHDMTALQSLWLGSQSASQVTVAALVYFYPFYEGRSRQVARNASKWFAAAAVMYLCDATMTANAILAVTLLLMFYYLPLNKLSGRAYKYGFVVLALLFAPVIWKVLTFRILSNSDWMVYFSAILADYDALEKSSLYSILWGYGATLAGAGARLDPNFGLGATFFLSGLVFTVFFFAMLFYIMGRGLRSLRQSLILQAGNAPVALLLMINLLLVMNFAFSLTHYTPAIELGGRHMFAFSLAASLWAIENLRAGRYSALGRSGLRA